MTDTKFLNRKNYKTLIVVGNGLDLAHEVKTSYSDFVNSRNFIELINSNNHLASFLLDKKNIQNWIDLEMELYNYSIGLTENNKKLQYCDQEKSDEKFKNEYFDLVKSLCQYLESLQNTCKTNEALKTLANHWISSSNNNILEVPIISFNYTLSSNVFFTYYQRQKRYHCVHGNIINGCCDAVVGIDDSQMVSPSHSFLYKSTNKNIKRNGISEVIKNAERYIIFGTSFGKTDDWYYKQIFNHEFEGKLYELYYFNGKSRDEINGRIIELTGNCLEFWSKNDKILLDSSKIHEKDFLHNREKEYDKIANRNQY